MEIQILLNCRRREFYEQSIYDGYNYKPAIAQIISKTYLKKMRWLLFLEHWEEKLQRFRFGLFRIGGERKGGVFFNRNESYVETTSAGIDY